MFRAGFPGTSACVKQATNSLFPLAMSSNPDVILLTDLSSMNKALESWFAHLGFFAVNKPIEFVHSTPYTWVAFNTTRCEPMNTDYPSTREPSKTLVKI